ncbi:hypothetical protein HMI54_007531 [Coelomomyces lativittatus]|nr:hypothetical protein HMI54_007531 [Coelomomyces lativittatus]
MTDFTPQRILWSGGLNSSSVILRLEADVKEKVLLYQSSNLELLLDNIEIQQKHVKLSKLTSNSSFNLNAEWVEVSFHSLSPNTYYSLFLVPLLPSSRFFLGKFSTFPTENTPFNFSFSAASCAKWQSSASSTYLDILSKNPFFFISSGDLFYGDISTNDITSFIQQYLSVLQTPTQKSFFSQISTFYIFGVETSPHKIANRWQFINFVSPHLSMVTISGLTPKALHQETFGTLALHYLDPITQTYHSAVSSHIEYSFLNTLKDTPTNYLVPQQLEVQAHLTNDNGEPLLLTLHFANLNFNQVFRVNVLNELPWLVRKAIQLLFANPVVYQFLEQVSLKLQKKDSNVILAEVSGSAIFELTYTNEV